MALYILEQAKSYADRMFHYLEFMEGEKVLSKDSLMMNGMYFRMKGRLI